MRMTVATDWQKWAVQRCRNLGEENGPFLCFPEDLKYINIQWEF